MPERTNPKEQYKHNLIHATHAWAVGVETQYIREAREYLSTIRESAESSVITHRLLDAIEAHIYPRFEYLDTNYANHFLQEAGYTQRAEPHQILVVYHACEISGQFYDCEFWRTYSRSLSSLVTKQAKEAKRQGVFLNRLSRAKDHGEMYHYFWTAELSRKVWSATNAQYAQV